MRSRTARWFETKVRYDKTDDDGKQKTVCETYAVDALSFSEAESSITGEMQNYISGEFEVVGEIIAPYGEIFFSDDVSDDKYYKAHLQFITLDEKSSKEKKQNVYYLVQAKSLEVARKHIDEVMSGTMIDYVIVGVNETRILDVFEHDKNVNENK